MFQENDVVVYGNRGVCRVVSIGPLAINPDHPEKLYYTLQPLYKNEAVIYAPVEGQKTVMRSVLEKDEIKTLLSEMESLGTVWVSNEKEREHHYKNAVMSADCVELIRLINTISQRKAERMQEGKKLTMLDERYFRMAESQLAEEVAYALGITKDEVDTYIDEHLVQTA